MAKRKKSALKHFSGYIEGDDELRKQIFKAKAASQQEIFELFSCLDHAYYAFFEYFCSLPSTGFWDLLTGRVSAAASGSDRNRNFSENYNLLETVDEEQSEYMSKRVKTLNLVGAAHSLWFELADPQYKEKPDTLALWQALYDTNPSRTVWEWWLEARYLEAKKLWDEYKNELDEPYVISLFEDWAEYSLGLCKPRSHWFPVLMNLFRTCEEVLKVKHKIAAPYLRLVYTLTKSIAASNQPDQFIDTYGIGCAGLMRGIAKYSPSMAKGFASFVETEIRYEIYYQLGNYNIISLPHQTWQKYRKLEEIKKKYHQETGVDLSLEEFVSIFHLDREEVFEIYSQILMQNPQSLDQKLYPDEDCIQDVTLKDKIEDSQIPELRQLVEDQEVLLLTLTRMPLVERKFFILTHDLCDLSPNLAPEQRELNRFFVLQN